MKITKTRLKEMVREIVKEQLDEGSRQSTTKRRTGSVKKHPVTLPKGNRKESDHLGGSTRTHRKHDRPSRASHVSRLEEVDLDEQLEEMIQKAVRSILAEDTYDDYDPYADPSDDPLSERDVDFRIRDAMDEHMRMHHADE